MKVIVEAVVGVFLTLFGVVAVILFIILCWGLVWKLLLSRLGLFKEIFGDLRGEKKEETSRRRVGTKHSLTKSTTYEREKQY